MLKVSWRRLGNCNFGWQFFSIILQVTVLLLVCLCAFHLTNGQRLRASPKFQRQEEKADDTPIPYSFKVDGAHEDGSVVSREEVSDGRGNVQGSYTIRDAQTGQQRTVKYVADDNGFRAEIDSNEQGIKTGESADAKFNKV